MSIGIGHDIENWGPTGGLSKEEQEKIMAAALKVARLEGEDLNRLIKEELEKKI